jgi:NitT/TauT family transport system ATP-binding protein
MSEAIALQVCSVSKRFETQDGPVVAVEDVSFDVRPGEFVSVIGPSGCGKTTLFNIIGGLLKNFEGQILFSGEKRRQGDRTVGMVFQEDSIFPWRTTLQNIAFPLEAAGVPVKQRLDVARRFVRLVGLEGFENRYPSELSGGMRQRTAIARTLAFNPKILLMDEPFASLDEQTRLLLGDKVLQIHRELRQTTLLITHNLAEAVQLSDRVLVMTYRPGRIKRIVDIELPRPRSSAVVSSEQFGRLVGMIWNDLREEATRGMDDTESRSLSAHSGAQPPG